MNPKPRRIVVLTGAGISAESGLATFRGAGGLWEGHRVEDVATPEAFAADPALVHRFYNMRRAALTSVAPNEAHRALARLEREFDGDLLLVTQNVDDLHERAGSTRLLHMHGELQRVLCRHCGTSVAAPAETGVGMACTACGRTGGIRPDIVWFGEMPYHMEEIYEALERCDLFVAIGTSGHVYPAAQFVQHAARNGAETLELNLEPSLTASDFVDADYGPASVIVPRFVDRVLS